ncbi:Gfo/Idh/MocA family protein [Bianquea renquensis]|jgi:oxidoreductase domain protein|uniref:Gfo/Idh/MocA family oxidoreductase n=1 Tax=Bianquea renquensis TaxID=2763661 RepID=A0A926DX18_9FIRM|nr:Gfo/Idh/MocA family oxidoreductase [Bianquea renquensis]MBC8545199.1 Gfo/Idh/MocA family oxidoreductase [Bianquea renquensis]
MKKIKIGQIGIGHNHGEPKMLAVRKFTELFEVTGYAEENDRWIEKRGNNKGYEGLPRLSVEEIIKKSDAVLIESDVWNVTKYARRCIEAGRHVHMDKPASSTPEEYKYVLDMAKEKNLVFQLGYMYRYNPAVLKCFEHIKNGDLGEIYSINAEMSTFHPVEYKKWLTNFGGGIMYILGSHLVDLIVYMLGEPKKITSFLKHTGFDGVDFEDNNLAVLEYEKALARIYVSSVEVNGFGRRQLMVSGSKGTVNIYPMERPITMTYSDTSIADKTYEDRKLIIPFEDNTATGRYDEMMRDFHAYILGTKQNPFPYEHDYLVQKVLDEIVGGVRFNGKNID